MFLRNVWIRAHAGSIPAATSQGLKRILSFVASYYLLWATADVLILGWGLDLGWAVRMLPNQLYYAFFVPFVWWTLARDR